jgi:hypothetical protein
VGSIAPGEACSHDGACKLANDETDGAKCRNGICVDCNDNDDHCGNSDKFCDRDNWKCEDKLKGGTECDGGDQCNCMNCDCNKCKSDGEGCLRKGATGAERPPHPLPSVEIAHNSS